MKYGSGLAQLGIDEQGVPAAIAWARETTSNGMEHPVVFDTTTVVSGLLFLNSRLA